jgi:hypothetical protein
MASRKYINIEMGEYFNTVGTKPKSKSFIPTIKGKSEDKKRNQPNV